MTTNPFELKKRFTSGIFATFDKTFMDKSRPTGLRFFTKRNPHFFERIIQRNINVYTVETMFVNLIAKYNEQILELCERDASKMNSTNSVCIYVKKDDIAMVVILFDDRDRDNCFSMMPLTILNNYEYQKCDYEIDLTNEEREIIRAA